MTYVLGIDPGPMCGLFGFYTGPVPADSTWLALRPAPDVIQCNMEVLQDVLHAIYIGSDTLIAMEAWVSSALSARGNDPAARAATKKAVDIVERFSRDDSRDIRTVTRSAANVKPWASDRRLAGAGFLHLTNGMRHARDGSRHALYAAVRDCGMRDPLSRKAKVST